MDDSNMEDESLPAGYRFVPNDEELVLHYLNLKLNGGSLPPLISEFNLYEKNPWEILERSYTGIFHVVTQLHYLSRQKVGRRAGSGTWKGENTKNICDEDGHVLWTRKAFVFEIDDDKIESTDVKCGHWLMTEFSLPSRVGNYVICKIYNKEAAAEATTTKPKRSKKRKLLTNTDSACVGSSKKTKKAIENFDYGTSVVPFSKDVNDLTLMPQPEPEPQIQNNVPSSDYDQMSFPQHNNIAGIESYVGMSEYGTPNVPITVFEDQSTENGYYPVFQDSHHLTFTVAPESEPVISNNIPCSDCYQEWFQPYDNTTGIETDMEVIPSPEYGTSLVPIPVFDIEDDRTLTRVPETNQEQVKQSTHDDLDIISETTFHGAQTSIVPEPVKQTTELEKNMMNDVEVPIEDTNTTSDFTTWLNNFMPLEEDNKDNAAVDYDLPLDYEQFPPLDYD